MTVIQELKRNLGKAETKRLRHMQPRVTDTKIWRHTGKETDKDRQTPGDHHNMSYGRNTRTKTNTHAHNVIGGRPQGQWQGPQGPGIGLSLGLGLGLGAVCFALALALALTLALALFFSVCISLHASLFPLPSALCPLALCPLPPALSG